MHQKIASVKFGRSLTQKLGIRITALTADRRAISTYIKLQIPCTVHSSTSIHKWLQKSLRIPKNLFESEI